MELKIRITGESPLMMHNRRLANPLDVVSKALKDITSKRKKTEDDHERLYFLEFQGSIYWDAKAGPYIPGENLEAALFEAGRLTRRGTTLERAIRVLEDKMPLIYDGPRGWEELYNAGSFADVRSVKNPSTGSRTMRCRPIFMPPWSFEGTIIFNPELINESDLTAVLTDAGSKTGILEYRPRYGKFTWEKIGGS